MENYNTLGAAYIGNGIGETKAKSIYINSIQLYSIK